MRVVAQRVIEAAVRVDGRIVEDRSTDLEWMARRLLRRRVFGVDIQLSSIDDGSVTIIIDSKAAA
ncbi:MAG TPA: hypothetical protein VJ001_03120 [Rhodocyclaceae bacterium]|nr:hypothetical protein [Rhodocyclaceae bacterium]